MGLVLGLMAWTQAIAVQTLDISACPGNLVLQQSASIKEPQLVSPSARTAAAVQLQATAQGWALRCQSVSSGSGSGSSKPAANGQTVISGVVINRAVGPGAVATQNIGGTSNVVRGDDTPALVVQVPAGWRLLAKAWTGTLKAEAGTWTVDVELANGEMQFSKLIDSQVVVDAGSIEVGEMTGQFVGHLRGAGSIEVANMRDPALELQLTGAGSMLLKGRAASARVRASGAGHIDIEHVTSEPWIQLSGSATVDIGR